MGNLADFPGELVAVRSGESLRDVPGPIDLAVVAVPAKAVPGVAADAAASGVAAMVVLSGGFAETGPDGVALQQERPGRRLDPDRPVRVVGPNCFGLQNCDLPMNASIAAGLPSGGGGISFVSQSGAYGMAIYDLAHDDRARFAKICAPGNTADVTIAELLAELVDDPASRTLCFLLESVRDGRAFVEHARRATPDKPVIVAKTGRSEAGARAAASHTAALAAQEAVWRGAFRQAGIVEVRSGQELLDVARALDGQPLPAGDRVAIITNSGGTGVELADLLADEGLTVPALSPGLQERIRAMLPAYASPVNPVDITPIWSRFAELYPGLVDILARSGEVDAVVPVLLQRAALDEATGDGLLATVRALRADGVPVPVYVCWVAPRRARPRADVLAEAGLPVFDWPARTARAAGLARRYARGPGPGAPARPGTGPSRRPGAGRRRPGRGGRAAGRVRRGDHRRRGVPDTGRGRRRGDGVPGRGEDRRRRAPHRAGRGAVGVAGRGGGAGGGGRAARRDRRGAGPAAAVRRRGGGRRVPRSGVRAGGDGRARRDLGRGARRRRLRARAAVGRRGRRPARLAARVPGAGRRPGSAPRSTSPRWPAPWWPPATCSSRSRRSPRWTSTRCWPPPPPPSPSTGRSPADARSLPHQVAAGGGGGDPRSTRWTSRRLSGGSRRDHGTVIGVRSTWWTRQGGWGGSRSDQAGGAG